MSSIYSGMILAAGLGKRMMTLTMDRPKPLIEINGISLLENSINFLKLLGCREIIINTHYKSLQIQRFINNYYDNKMIKLIYEKDLLDTGGGVRNASPYFSHENILLINSDIFWQNSNLSDVKLLIKLYLEKKNMYLLLSKKDKSYGLNNHFGDFNINDGKLFRFNKGQEVIYYSGLQIFHLSCLKGFSKKKFSFNEIWDLKIKKNKLFGKIMNSNLYHVGDIQGLNIARKLNP